MTISSEDSYVRYTADGSQVDYSFTFPFISSSDIEVYEDGSITATTDYTLTPEVDNIGGTITFDTAPADGVVVHIVRDVPLTQLLDLIAYGSFPAEAIESAFDKLTMLVQQAGNDLDLVVNLNFRYLGEWTATTEYKQLNVVKYGEAYYICPADFTSGASFDADNWTVLLDYSDAMQDMQDAVDDAADTLEDSLALLGVDQDYDSFTVGVDRSLDSYYTNSTGKPVLVTLTLQSSGAWGVLATVNSGGGHVPVAKVTEGATGNYVQVSFIVPTGAEYGVETGTEGTPSYIYWAELR